MHAGLFLKGKGRLNSVEECKLYLSGHEVQPLFISIVPVRLTALIALH